MSEQLSKPFAALLKSRDDKIAELKAKLAEREWVSVEGRLPEDLTHCLVFTPDPTGEIGPIIDFEYWEDGCWMSHTEHYEHFVAVGGYSMGGDDCDVVGPRDTAPYTHWMPLPTPPEAE